MSARATRLAFLAIVAAYLVAQLAGLRSIGLTDDDDYYIPAGLAYTKWLGDAASFRDGAWTREAIDAAFEPNKEHPPVAKYVFGLCARIFGFLGDADGARVGTVLFSTLIAALLVTMSIEHLGRRRGLWVGGLAVAFSLFLPRFYFHSHAATLDVPVAALYLATAWCALRAERSTVAGILVGPIFGLALATKLNAPFFVLPYLAFVFLVRRGSACRAPIPSTNVRLPAIPVALVSMLAIGPLVFLAVWPRMWFDVGHRVAEYVGFHLHHYGIHFLYFGQVYTQDPFAPWHAPFVMALVTIPLATTAFACAGLSFALPILRARLRFTVGPDDDMRREGDLVLTAILHAAFTISIVAFFRGPKYGGEKLFMPFFPFFCLLAGYGAERAFHRLGDAFRSRWVALVTVGVGLASAAALSLRFGAYALSEYNGLVGGLRGATALGFERQYYDVAFRDLSRWIDEHAEKNAKIHFLPNNWEYIRTYGWYERTGARRGDIRVVSRETEADLVVLTHERRFARYGEDLARYRTRPVMFEKRVDGVPIWTVFDARSRRGSVP